MDHRAVRLALGLTIAGASMLTAGVATWLITAIGAGHLRRGGPRPAAGRAGPAGRRRGMRARDGGRAWPPPAGPGRAPRRDGPGGRRVHPRRHGGPAGCPAGGRPRSLMNPPPPSPPPPWSEVQRPQDQWPQEQWPAGAVAGAGAVAAGAGVRRSRSRGPGLVAGRAQPGQRLGRHLRGVAPLAARPGHPAAAPAQRRVTEAAGASRPR